MALRDIGTSPNYVSFRQQRTLSNSKLHSHRRPLLYKGGGRQSTHLHHVVRQLRVTSSLQPFAITYRFVLVS
jgi:hypothetical protein